MNRTIVAAPRARQVAAVKVAATRQTTIANLRAAALKSACLPAPVREPLLRDRKPSKRIALTVTEVAALRLAARVAGLIK